MKDLIRLPVPVTANDQIHNISISRKMWHWLSICGLYGAPSVYLWWVAHWLTDSALTFILTPMISMRFE